MDSDQLAQDDFGALIRKAGEGSALIREAAARIAELESALEAASHYVYNTSGAMGGPAADASRELRSRIHDLLKKGGE